MAGVLGQTNATLLEVLQAAPLGDSFLSDSFGSGSGDGPEDQTAKWAGHVGVWMPPERTTRDSSPDGRDVVTDRRVLLPPVCSVEVGDLLRIKDKEGNETIYKASGSVLLGEGFEVGASQIIEVQIEVS